MPTLWIIHIADQVVASALETEYVGGPGPHAVCYGLGRTVHGYFTGALIVLAKQVISPLFNPDLTVSERLAQQNFVGFLVS